MFIAERIFRVNTNIGNVENNDLVEMSSTSACKQSGIGFNRKQFVTYVLNMETVITFNCESAPDFNPVHLKTFQIAILFSSKCPKFVFNFVSYHKGNILRDTYHPTINIFFFLLFFVNGHLRDLSHG